MFTIGTETFDASNADTLTKSFLVGKGALTKTQSTKYPYQDQAQKWANSSMALTFESWAKFGKALGNPKPTDQLILTQKASMSWYPEAIDPHWRGRPVIPFEITAYLFSFLDDRSMASAEQVNTEFRNAAMEVRLPSSAYTPQIAEGQRENRALSAGEHRQLGLDAYSRAKQAKQIVLYRQWQKKAFLTETEIGKYTVSSFPWTPEKTAAWILGGIQSRKTFIVITELNKKNLLPDKNYGIPVLTREIAQLLQSGYTPSEMKVTTLAKLVGKTMLVFEPSEDAEQQTGLDWVSIWSRASKTLKISYPNSVIVEQEITGANLPDVVGNLLKLA